MKLDKMHGETTPVSDAYPAPKEAERLRILETYGLDGLEDDPELAAIASFAAKLCEAPVAMVSLVEEERQRFLVREGLEARETPRQVSFCAHAMLQDGVMVVPDARLDIRFSGNPLVTGDPDVRFYAGQPLHSTEGVPLGSLCILDNEPRQDLTEFQREGLKVLATSVVRRLASRRFSLKATRDLEQSKNQIEALIDSIPDMAFASRPDGHIEYFNRRWYEYTGEEQGFQFDRSFAHVYADDRAKAVAMWERAIATGEPSETEFRYRRADGDHRWMLVRVMPSRTGDGPVDRWFGTLTDIDDTYRESESRDLLARELSHRIKNIFAVVSGLISIRARGKPEIRDFADDLTQTVRALGRAHDYVRPLEDRKVSSLQGLLGDLLKPYRNGSDERIKVSGDDRPIGARAATPLALVFHELATNSAKYGALSTDHGTVSISIQPDATEDGLQMIWRETAGDEPPKDGPKGFGSRLVKMAVEGQLGGTIERYLSDDGMCVELTVSTAAIAS